MSQRRKILFSSMLIMVAVASGVTAIAITVLYRTAFEQRRTQLTEIARVQAHFMEAVVRFDAVHSQQDNPEGAAATFSQIADAHRNYPGFGQTGEFVLAHRVDNQIVFLLPYRHGNGADPVPVPWGSNWAEPMRRALSGKSGTLVGLDYRGEPVLAAHEHVNMLDFGIVAKIDVAEIRAPFMKAAAMAASVTILFVILGAYLTLRVSDPLIHRLQESESMTRAIIAGAADGIIAINERGIVESYNEAAEQMFGYPAQEVVGQNVKILIPSPHRDQHGQYLQRYLDTGEKRVIGQRREVVGRRKDGTTFPADLHVSEVHLRSRRIFAGIIRDITEQKKAESELQYITDQHKAINKNLLAINDIQQKLFECHTIQKVADFVTNAMVDKFQAYFARVWLLQPGDLCSQCSLAQHCPQQEECLHLISSAGHYTHIDGDHRRVPTGAFKIGLVAQGRGKTISTDVANDERVHDREWAAQHGLQSFVGLPLVVNGKVIGVVAMFSKQELPDHLLDTYDILAKLVAAAIGNVNHLSDLKHAMAVASAANQSKSEFLANMSHEIRTPMTAILGFTDILLEPGSNASDVLNASQTIRRNGQALLNIINDILDLSKIEAGKLDVERIACSPCQIVADVQSLMRVRADAKNLTLDIEYDGLIPETIQSDPVRIRQILINLVGNAVKFTETGGVRLVARWQTPDPANGSTPTEPMMQFDVIDTGIGMTAEQAARLFQPFAQADTSTTRKFGGTGLGLTISKRLANMLGGDIHVKTDPGYGSIFRITITTGLLDNVKWLKTPEEASRATVEKPRTAPTPAAAPQLNCRILLAEDGPDNQRLISHVLRKAGADVTVVENGQLAVEQILSTSSIGIRATDTTPDYDVILMDMQMPVLDGYSATRLLRSKGYTAPIIALTAHAMAGDRDKCLATGCDDYATKPINRRALIETIAAHLSSSPVA